MDSSYARRKHGEEEASEPLRNTWDLVEDTYGVIVYQEQIMKISMRIANFDSNQSDSIVRKIFAKKKKEDMERLRRMLFYGKINAEGPKDWETDNGAPWYDAKEKYGAPIRGACNNGYTEEEMSKFWEIIQGFSEYLFNKSHSMCYAYIGILTAWLKTYYPVQFMAALLSAQKEDEKIAHYVGVAEKMKITIKAPDINKSGVRFTPIAESKTILYGLGSVKGIGKASLNQLITNQPYQSLEDVMERVDKKAFNKTVGINLIKAGAFDFLSNNRLELMNYFMTLRKDKDEKYDVTLYNENACIEMEREVLGAPITYKPWWDSVEPNKKISVVAELISVSEHTDKNGRLMASATLRVNECQVKSRIFASKYCKLVDMFDMKLNTHIMVEGKKDDNGMLLINKAYRESA